MTVVEAPPRRTASSRGKPCKVIHFPLTSFVDNCRGPSSSAMTHIGKTITEERGGRAEMFLCFKHLPNKLTSPYLTGVSL
ncbi:hypothetical protein BCR43DRAFT_496347, partial [Syncephalastrum racemosum]